MHSGLGRSYPARAADPDPRYAYTGLAATPSMIAVCRCAATGAARSPARRIRAGEWVGERSGAPQSGERASERARFSLGHGQPAHLETGKPHRFRGTAIACAIRSGMVTALEVQHSKEVTVLDVVWGVVLIVLAVWAVWELARAARRPAPTSPPWKSSARAMLPVSLAMVLHLADGGQSMLRLLSRLVIIIGALGPFLVDYVRWKRSGRVVLRPMPEGGDSRDQS